MPSSRATTRTSGACDPEVLVETLGALRMGFATGEAAQPLAG
jgi:hypothetical protein